MTEEIQEQISEEPVADLQGEGNGTETEEITTQPQGLTQDQIREIMREERALTAKQVAEETAKAFRAMQSMSDKKAAQVKNMAEQQVELMVQSGAQITPEMRANYVNMLVNKYRESLANEAPESAQIQPQQASEANPLLDTAKLTVQHFANKFGVTIDDEVSAKMNELFTGVTPRTYQEFLQKAESYLEAKAKTVKTPPQARMASVVGNSGSSKPTAETYKKEVLAHRGNRGEIEKIKEKYRKLGIDVDRVKWSQ